MTAAATQARTDGPARASSARDRTASIDAGEPAPCAISQLGPRLAYFALIKQDPSVARAMADENALFAAKQQRNK